MKKEEVVDTEVFKPFAALPKGFVIGHGQITVTEVNDEKEWVEMTLTTARHKMRIYVMRNGRVQVQDQDGEWRAK